MQSFFNWDELESKCGRISSQGSTASGASYSSTASQPHSAQEEDEEWADAYETEEGYELLRDQSTFAEWTVELQRTPGKLGMRVRPTMRNAAVGVLSIAEGDQVEKWNEEHASQHIQPGDVVLEVNGVSGDHEKMKAELQSASTLELRLARAVRLPVVLDRLSDGAAGFGFLEEHLRVTTVQAELQGRYRDVMPVELRMWPGDKVVIANGRHSEGDMRRQLNKANHVELILQRPLPGSDEAAVCLEARMERQESDKFSKTLSLIKTMKTGLYGSDKSTESATNEPAPEFEPLLL